MLYPYNHDVKTYTIVSVCTALLDQTMELNFNCSVVQPPEAWYPSRHSKAKMWLPIGFGRLLTMTLQTFVMDCKLGRVDSESGKYRSSV